LISDNTPNGAIAQSGFTYDGNTLIQKSSTQNTPKQILSGVTLENINVTLGSRTVILSYPKSDFRQLNYEYTFLRTSPASPSRVMVGAGFTTSDGTNTINYPYTLAIAQPSGGPAIGLSANTGQPDATYTINGTATETYTVKINFSIIK
jgi:hypothetical protein